ncbi:LysR family transcriptional regulator (plasmid) [Deinococcus taeanensis]|uniref:LysR family transcriptional regulator n=1 Tax=Deinococcus taeanensis TaxID=2737050 RepID=UPI001CDC4BA4|nr:LysR family transcriptional regulator [Deinococcus taeanensis]UBV44492.1 LysR family transcriptional regulator [Deinococcus taeanensis]
MELRQLKYFVAVAEELHFARAAERLHLAQQPLSAQIKKLEGDLGVRLFERTTRKVELTPAGAALLPEAKAALSHVQRGTQSARLAAQGSLGRLTVGYVSTTVYNVMPATMRVFRERFPDVKVTLRELCPPHLEAAILAGEVQAGFLIPQQGYPDLLIEPLVRERVMVALPNGHALSLPGQVPLRSLAQESFVNYDRDVAPHVHDEVIALCRAGGFSPRVVQSAGSDQAVLGLVAAGVGVAFVAECLTRVRVDEVTYREVVDPSSSVTYGLALRRGDASPLVKGLRQVARAVAKASPTPR